MMVGDAVSGVVAVVLGYLVGSFPSAYIVTRLVKGKDIRRIGTGHTGIGNMGARNVFVNVGKLAGVVVAVLDIAKGAGAILVAEWLLGWPRPSLAEPRITVFFALASGLAAVAGHIWPVYIRFVGGAGLATSIGVLAVVMTSELLLALSIVIVLVFITRNVILSANLGLLTIPAWAWLNGRPWWMVLFPLVIAAIMLVHFMPNIVAEVKKAGSFERLVAGLLRRDRPGPRR